MRDFQFSLATFDDDDRVTMGILSPISLEAGIWPPITMVKPTYKLGKSLATWGI